MVSYVSGERRMGRMVRVMPRDGGEDWFFADDEAAEEWAASSVASVYDLL